MDQCTHEVRAEYWKNIITQCQSRPAGQTASQWLKENGIVEQTYYRWQRILRQKTYNEISTSLPATTSENEITFAEVKLKNQSHSNSITSDVAVHPVAVIKTDTMSIALTNDISESVLSRILQEVAHA